MLKPVTRTLLPLCLLALAAAPLCAQRDNWTKPFPGHRVIGNLYSVGIYDLGCYLVTSDEGHILINTGIDGSTELIRDNVKALGFDFADIKILLTMQAHWDHTAKLAEIQDLTGAEMWATPGDKPLLEDGGFSDPLFGGKQTFDPIEVDRVIRDGDVIELGETRLTVIEMPGHTVGSSSYTMKVREGGRDYNVAIVNMASINPGTRLAVNPTYEGMAEDYATTFRKQKTLPVDVWVAGHASQYNLHDKYKPGDAYSPDTFADPEGYKAAVARYEKIYLDQLAEEKR